MRRFGRSLWRSLSDLKRRLIGKSSREVFSFRLDALGSNVLVLLLCSFFSASIDSWTFRPHLSHTQEAVAGFYGSVGRNGLLM